MKEYESVINSFEELIRYNSGMIEAIGDCPNIERPIYWEAIYREPIFWQRIASKGRFTCQMNLFTGKCRIVSSSGRQVANGSRKVMLEKMKRLSSPSFLEPGDVIGVSRKGIYEHYAIYIGNDRVIHYCGEGNDFAGTVCIHEADISEFLKDSKRYFVVWFDNGIPYKIQSETSFLFTGALDYYNAGFQKANRTVFSAGETIRRARSRIGETEYNLITNNCEHFAMWCKTGVSESSQVKNIARAAFASGVTGYGLWSPEAKRLLTTT